MKQSLDTIEVLLTYCGFTDKTKYLWLSSKFHRPIHQLKDLTTEEQLNVICALNLYKKMKDEANQLDEVET